MKTSTCLTLLAALFLTAPAAYATHCHEFDHFKTGLYYSAKPGATTKPVNVVAQLSLTRFSVNGTSVETSTGGEINDIVLLKAVGDHFYAEQDIVSKVGECTDMVTPTVSFIVYNADNTLEMTEFTDIKTIEGTGPVLETETNAVHSKEQYAD